MRGKASRRLIRCLEQWSHIGEWAALLIVQMLDWFQAMTLAGFQPGDVWFDNAGNLNIRVRFMKMRKEIETEPGLVFVPR